MKASFFLCLIVLTLCSSPSLVAQTPDEKDLILFDLANALNLTDHFSEAERCYARLVPKYPEWIELLNNHGVNLSMAGLSLLEASEADSLIKYVFPLEVSTTTGGGEKGFPKFDSREEMIVGLFSGAIQQFEQVVELQSDYAGAWLNLACAEAFLAQWTGDQVRLRSAFQHINQAEKMAAEGSTTKGHCLIVKGIIYDYRDNTAKREEYFDLARRQNEVYPDEELSSLIERNTTISEGGTAVFASTSGENYDLFSLNTESIDAVSLKGWIYENEASPYAELFDIQLFYKAYPASKLYVFQDENRYLLFHRTNQKYGQKSLKEIALGDSEAKVRQAYGSPLRVRADSKGKYLYYQQNGIIFFIQNDGTVGEWIVCWREG